jgi:hypothetical protein
MSQKFFTIQTLVFTVTSAIFLVAPALAQKPTSKRELAPGQESWYQRYKSQQNAPELDEMLINEDSEPDLQSGFEPLFNGEDLTGWTPLGGHCEFKVVDGAIEGTCVPGSPSTYLSTERKNFKDFIFTCDVKWLVDCNSGVMFRARSKPGKKKNDDGESRQIVYGPQVEMEGFSRDRYWSGGIYGQSCGGYFYPLWLKAHQPAHKALKKEGWNRVTVQAVGNEVKTWVNGVPAAYWVDEGEYPEGFFGLQIHAGKQGKVQFRNLRVKEL